MFGISKYWRSQTYGPGVSESSRRRLSTELGSEGLENKVQEERSKCTVTDWGELFYHLFMKRVIKTSGFKFIFRISSLFNINKILKSSFGDNKLVFNK